MARKKRTGREPRPKRNRHGGRIKRIKVGKKNPRTGRREIEYYAQIQVQKPFCSPCRGIVWSALNMYDIPIARYREWPRTVKLSEAAKIWEIELRQQENLKYGALAAMWLPLAMHASFYVPEKRLVWAQTILECTGQLAVCNLTNSSVRDWARKRNGAMPAPWKLREMSIPPDVARMWFSRKNLLADTAPSGWMDGSKPVAMIDSDCDKGKEEWKAVQEWRDERRKEQEKEGEKKRRSSRG